MNLLNDQNMFKINEQVNMRFQTVILLQGRKYTSNTEETNNTNIAVHICEHLKGEICNFYTS